jgi:hypothetical protein
VYELADRLKVMIWLAILSKVGTAEPSRSNCRGKVGIVRGTDPPHVDLSATFAAEPVIRSLADVYETGFAAIFAGNPASC